MGEVTRITSYELDRYRNVSRFSNGLPTGIGYLRVSTEAQVVSGHGLDTQEGRIIETLNKEYGQDGYNLIIIADEGITGTYHYRISGKDPKKVRDGFRFATELMAEGGIDFFAVYKISRTMRTPKIYYDLVEEFIKPYKVRLISASEPIDLSTPVGEGLAGFWAVLAGWEYTQITQQTRDGLENRMRLGYPNGKPPYGWKSQDRRLLAKGDYVGIVIHEEQAEAVQWMFESYDSGRSISWIICELERRKIPSPTGDPVWRDPTVRQVLRNPIHAGWVKHNGVISQGAHHEQSFIDQILFDSVQRRLDVNSNLTGRTTHSDSHIYGFLAHCALCGERIRVERKPDGKSRYVCNGGHGKSHHPRFSVSVDLVDEHITSRIRDLLNTSESLETAKEKLEDYLFEKAVRSANKKAELAAKKRKQEEKLKQIKAQFADDIWTPEEYVHLERAIIAEIDSIQARIDGKCTEISDRESMEARVKHGMTLLRQFTLWESLEMDQKRGIGAHAIEDVLFEPRDGGVDIHLQMILCKPETFRVPVRGRGGRKSKGFSASTATELTTAHLLIQGLTVREVAERRAMLSKTIYMHVARIKRCAGVDDLQEALKLIAPVVEARQNELILDSHKIICFEDMFSKVEIQLLRFMAKGMTIFQMAQARGRSVNTILSQIAAIYEKLHHPHNRRQAVRRAEKLGLIEGRSSSGQKPTEKQFDAIRALAAGCKEEAAAKSLDMTLSAFKGLTKRARKKFGVKKTKELLRIARERGWIDG